MKRGSSAKRPGRKGSSSRSSRERTLLTVLLVVIALLLGIIVALLPREAVSPDSFVDVEPDTPTVAADRVGREDAAPQAPRPTEEAVSGDSEADPPVEPGAGARRSEDVSSADEEEAAEEASEETWWLPRGAVAAADRGPLVFVLDDAGNSLEAFADFLRFPAPLAVAVLPQLDYSVQASALTAAAGKEIMLHLPMEALNGANPGPGAIGPGLTAKEIVSLVDENLATVPGAIGVNNHMGSLATADHDVMRAVLGRLHERDLFFLDSRTSAATVARLVAQEVGIPFAERNVFLDNERTREAILSSLQYALELAQTGEPVIMIGHATVPLLAEILNEVYPVLDRAGYRFVGVSELVRPVRIGAEN